MTEELVKVENNQARDAYLTAIRADGATDNEVAHMLYLAEKHNLDPLNREIYLLPFKDKKGKPCFLTYVSYAGLVKCAHLSGFFDGIEEELVFGEDGRIIGARARVWTKTSSHACVALCMMTEYNKGYSVWATMPGAMIMKCAKARALRDAFNLEGLYIEEELMSPMDTKAEPLKQEIKEKKKIAAPKPVDDGEPAF